MLEIPDVSIVNRILNSIDYDVRQYRVWQTQTSMTTEKYGRFFRICSLPQKEQISVYILFKSMTRIRITVKVETAQLLQDKMVVF